MHPKCFAVSKFLASREFVECVRFFSNVKLFTTGSMCVGLWPLILCKICRWSFSSAFEDFVRRVLDQSMKLFHRMLVTNSHDALWLLEQAQKLRSEASGLFSCTYTWCQDSWTWESHRLQLFQHNLLFAQPQGEHMAWSLTITNQNLSLGGTEGSWVGEIYRPHKITTEGENYPKDITGLIGWEHTVSGGAWSCLIWQLPADAVRESQRSPLRTMSYLLATNTCWHTIWQCVCVCRHMRPKIYENPNCKLRFCKTWAAW